MKYKPMIYGSSLSDYMDKVDENDEIIAVTIRHKPMHTVAQERKWNARHHADDRRHGKPVYGNPNGSGQMWHGHNDADYINRPKRGYAKNLRKQEQIAYADDYTIEKAYVEINEEIDYLESLEEKFFELRDNRISMIQKVSALKQAIDAIDDEIALIGYEIALFKKEV